VAPRPAASDEHRLGELADLLLGRTPAPQTDDTSGPIFVGLAELSDRERPTRRAPATDDKAIVLQPGDVVVARLSNIGASTLVTPDRLAGAVLGRECVALRPTDQGVTGDWLYLWTLSEHFLEQVRRSTSGGVMPRLDGKALRNFVVPVPDLATQAALHASDVRFDAALAELRQLVSDVAELRQLELNIAVAEIVESATLKRIDGGEDT